MRMIQQVQNILVCLKAEHHGEKWELFGRVKLFPGAAWPDTYVLSEPRRRRKLLAKCIWEAQRGSQ